MRTTLRWILSVGVAAMLSTSAHAVDPAADAARNAEAGVRGDFAAMLRYVEASPKMPHLRLHRSVDEHTEVLHLSGRFAELGLTRDQGRKLVAAFYRRQGISERGMRPVAAAASSPSMASSPVLTNPPAGWRSGAEFEPLQAVQLRWPFDAQYLLDEYVLMVRAITEGGAEARIWVNTDRQSSAAKRALRRGGVDLAKVRFIVEKTDSIWLRDYGPLPLLGPQSGEWGVTDFHYYEGRPDDDDTPQVVAEAAGVPRVDRQSPDNRVFTEGGNLNTDGLGTVLYSTRTYRGNPGVARGTIDARIRSGLAAPNGIVLTDPSLDGTGHVDMFSKIVSPNTVLVAQYDADEKDHAVLEANASTLAGASNGAGQPWNVVRIRQPDVYYVQLVLPVVRTYTNGLIVNNRVIVPTYGIADDAGALAVWQQVLPGKVIVPVDARDIIEGSGAWHCVTMEVPRTAP